jgi:hypothetical protein
MWRVVLPPRKVWAGRHNYSERGRSSARRASEAAGTAVPIPMSFCWRRAADAGASAVRPHHGQIRPITED